MTPIMSGLAKHDIVSSIAALPVAEREYTVQQAFRPILSNMNVSERIGIINQVAGFPAATRHATVDALVDALLVTGG